jgi:catechol 2,3-dioxygenase-like lactoylglutathione lyase family enzyme/predicted enzyme related to lactoylglutathione lyase
VKRSAFVLTILALCIATYASNSPKRPRIFGIAKVQIFATNLPDSHDFYSRVLKVGQPTDCNWCERVPTSAFSVNGLQIVALSPAPTVAPSNLIEGITFATDDIPALRRYLVFHKIEVSKPDKPLDNHLTLTDPEGHRISFLQWPKSIPELAPDFLSRLQIIHAGFVVNDRAAEDHFYKDILGFRLYWQGGMKDGETSWVAMQVPDGTDWLEYMLNIAPDADKHTLGVMNHIALGVPDIQAAKAQLIKNGWKPGEEPKMGRDGKWQLNLYDPDDTRVEFMEFKPVEKPCCSEFTGPHPGPQQ